MTQKGFHPVKISYFCVSQQKKRTARKELVKKIAILGRVNRLYVKSFWIWSSKIQSVLTGRQA